MARGRNDQFNQQGFQIMSTSDLTTPDKPAATSWIVKLASSAGGIYGLIVVSGVIVVTRNLTATSWDALVAVLGTLFVFFAAHTYAATLSEMSQHRLSFPVALRAGFVESIGMLFIGLVPVVVLSLGVIGVLRPVNAVWLALLVDMLFLGVLGWYITATRIHNMWARIGGAAVTAGFGGLIIALKVFIH